MSSSEEIKKLLVKCKDPAEKQDLLDALRHARINECMHYNCRPIEWYWSGSIRVMHCDDCNYDEFRNE